MFDETYVLMIFPTYISSSFGSNRNICFSLRKTFDPRRGFRHLYILHSLTVATRGVKTYVDRCNWPSKSYVLRPKSYVKNALTSPDIEKRCRSNICFELQKHMFCQLKTYVLSGLTRPLGTSQTRRFFQKACVKSASGVVKSVSVTSQYTYIKGQPTTVRVLSHRRFYTRTVPKFCLCPYRRALLGHFCAFW